MSKDKTYNKMIQSARWRQLRILKLSLTPTCEMCNASGKIKAAQCVHHKIPVESAKSEAQAEVLCFNLNNLQSLCFGCHQQIHNAQRYHSRESHRRHTQDAFERWREKHKV